MCTSRLTSRASDPRNSSCRGFVGNEATAVLRPVRSAIFCETSTVVDSPDAPPAGVEDFAAECESQPAAKTSKLYAAMIRHAASACRARFQTANCAPACRVIVTDPDL